MSIFFGYIFDTYFNNLEMLTIMNHSEELNFLNYISTTIMFGLIFFYMLKK